MYARCNHVKCTTNNNFYCTSYSCEKEINQYELQKYVGDKLNFKVLTFLKSTYNFECDYVDHISEPILVVEFGDYYITEDNGSVFAYPKNLENKFYEVKDEE